MNSVSPVHGRITRTVEQAWIPLGDGQSFRPIAFGPGRARQLVLRVEPGVVVGLHRHHGEVHAYTLSGQRRLLDPAGPVDIGPGDYVYEPAGNVDSWMAFGDEPCIVHIAIDGPMDTLGPDGEVRSSSGTPELLAAYRKWCAANHRRADERLVVR